MGQLQAKIEFIPEHENQKLKSLAFRAN